MGKKGGAKKKSSQHGRLGPLGCGKPLHREYQKTAKKTTGGKKKIGNGWRGGEKKEATGGEGCRNVVIKRKWCRKGSCEKKKPASPTNIQPRIDCLNKKPILEGRSTETGE